MDSVEDCQHPAASRRAIAQLCGCLPSVPFYPVSGTGRHLKVSGEHHTVGSVRTAATVIQHLRETRVGHDEEACQKRKRCCWNEAQKSKGREAAGESQLACGLGVGWSFGRGLRNPERGGQPAFWEVRPLGLDGRLGAHPIFSRCHLSSAALGVMADL